MYHASHLPTAQLSSDNLHGYSRQHSPLLNGALITEAMKQFLLLSASPACKATTSLVKPVIRRCGTCLVRSRSWGLSPTFSPVQHERLCGRCGGPGGAHGGGALVRVGAACA